MNFQQIKSEVEEVFTSSFKNAEFGSKLVFLESVDSTNLYAIRNAAALPDGAVILANSQSTGRGRKGRNWYSPPELGLYMTILLKQDFAPGETMLLNLLASVSACDTVNQVLSENEKETGIKKNLELKWPNDLLFNSKKLGGILSERKAENGAPPAIAIGIGLNINHKLNDFPSELAQNAVSLFIIDGIRRKPWNVAVSITDNFNRRFAEFRAKGKEWLILSWMSFSPASKGERVKIISDNEEFYAVTEGLDASGFLKVRRYGDRLQTILAADIVSLRRE